MFIVAKVGEVLGNSHGFETFSYLGIRFSTAVVTIYKYPLQLLGNPFRKDFKAIARLSGI